jgi:DNA-directed RNA polymerase specialized sigma24 family protein/LysM repeat protein
MFDRDPELSPDLVWLLQSQPVEDGLLARMLVQETYAQILPFWEALLGDPQKAQNAALETFSNALLKTSTFHEPQSILSWLCGLAIDLYRKDQRKAKQGHLFTAGKELQLSQLSRTSLLAVVLRFRLDFTPQETAQLLGEKLPAIETRLWAARQLLLGQIGKGRLGGSPPLEIDPLAQAFQQAYPTPTFSEIELELISQEVIARAQNKRSRLLRTAYWKEIGMISAVILVVLVWMGRAHLDAPEITATPVVAAAMAGSAPRPTRSPTATHRVRPSQPPPSTTSTSKPDPALSTPTPIPEDAFYVVQEGDTLWGIAISLGTTVEALRSLNRLPEEAILQPGQRLLKPGSLKLDTPAPSSPPISLQTSVTPLPRANSVDEILQRRGSLPVRSLWFDMQIIYRGSQGYLGETQTFRMQIWSSTAGLLLLAGNDHASPDTAFKMRFNEQSEIYMAQPKFGNPWFEYRPSSAEFDAYIQIIFNLFDVQADHWGDQPVNTILVGSGKSGDRPAYILNQLNQQQRLLRTIWIDMESGLPLRIQIFDPNRPQRVTTEILMTGLEINPDISQALLNPQIPWLGGFAKNSQGDSFAPGENISPWKATPVTRLTWPYTPAPLNLNLATSPLQFQYGQLSPLFLDPNSLVHYQVEIFAGNKYLGLATMPNPFFTLCARSPDGRRIAYAPAGTNTRELFSGQVFPGGLIHWIDLNAPSTEHAPAPDLQPISFAFSPDGEQLAVYGENNVRGIYLVDLQSEDVRYLQYADLAYSLVWKPDGKQLAYISQAAGPPSNASLVVLDMESGKVLSRQSFPMPGDPPAKNVLIQPPLQWKVPFPVGMGDLGACAARPVNR